MDKPEVETGVRITRLEIAWESGGTWCLLNLDNRGQEHRLQGYLRTGCPCCEGQIAVRVDAYDRYEDISKQLQPLLESLTDWCRRSASIDLRRAAAGQHGDKSTGERG